MDRKASVEDALDEQYGEGKMFFLSLPKVLIIYFDGDETEKPETMIDETINMAPYIKDHNLATLYQYEVFALASYCKDNHGYEVMVNRTDHSNDTKTCYAFRRDGKKDEVEMSLICGDKHRPYYAMYRQLKNESQFKYVKEGKTSEESKSSSSFEESESESKSSSSKEESGSESKSSSS